MLLERELGTLDLLAFAFLVFLEGPRRDAHRDVWVATNETLHCVLCELFEGHPVLRHRWRLALVCK